MNKDLLSDFFAGTFHQDMEFDAEDWRALVGLYGGRTTIEKSRRVADEIEVGLIGSGMDDHDLREYIQDELGSHYDCTIEWKTTRDWLGAIVDALRSS